MKLCGFDVGLDQPLFLIAGPCVIESSSCSSTSPAAEGNHRQARHQLHLQVQLRQGQPHLGTSFRGPGMEEGLRVLAEVKRSSACRC
jgi:2-dehydro-3-deoxyphosphooctonate aldolase (KDO 8-P synthase)